MKPEEFHYWQLLQVISHISVNVIDLSDLVTESYSGDQLTRNFFPVKCVQTLNILIFFSTTLNKICWCGFFSIK